jgi:hypothetical protein
MLQFRACNVEIKGSSRPSRLFAPLRSERRGRGPKVCRFLGALSALAARRSVRACPASRVSSIKTPAGGVVGCSAEARRAGKIRSGYGRSLTIQGRDEEQRVVAPGLTSVRPKGYRCTVHRDIPQRQGKTRRLPLDSQRWMRQSGRPKGAGRLGQDV